MYPHHVFDLEPAGTFRMYPICYRWVSGGYLQPEPAMYSRCFRWFPGPLAPSVYSLSLLLYVIRHYFCLYFLSIFDPTSLHILYPTFLPYVYPCYFSFLYAFMLTDRQQEHNLIGTTGHQTTHLLDCRHSKAVLSRFLLNPILRWNLLCHHQTLPPFKVPDFLDTEHE